MINEFNKSLSNDDIFNILTNIKERTSKVTKRRYRRKAIKYWNVPCAFDIETTSTYINGNKTAWMYEWTFGIEDTIFIGRTWEEWINLNNMLANVFELDETTRLYVGVHNLAFEFQFMRLYFHWIEVFSNGERHPIKALNNYGLEFRCTATLSALPLDKLADNLINHSIKKLKGDLDYTLIRTAATPLSNAELGYCINDVRIILYYLYEQMDLFGDISKIVLTNTGRVRNYCRNQCLTLINRQGKRVRNHDYMNLIHSQTLTPELYNQCKLAFRGGFTHANAFNAMKVCENVSSYDLTSAYPSVMLYELFPKGAPAHVDPANLNKETFQWYLNNRCCLFRVTYHNLVMRDDAPDAYISWIHSKMDGEDVNYTNNGRVISAKSLTMFMTEIDWQIISRVYKWTDIDISDMTVWFKDYLPTELIKCVLEFYKAKTELKGVPDKIVEYFEGKGKLNSIYGMMVQDIAKDVIDYSDNNWSSNKSNLNDTIDYYNNSNSRFTYYATGLWITAYCRRLVWQAIIAIGKEDYCYTDTDSVKFMNLDKHKDWFEYKNSIINKKVEQAMKHHNLDASLAAPRTVKGESKPIGVFDYEGTYNKFKTLGAKRYMVMKEHEYGKDKGICPIKFMKMNGKFNHNKFEEYELTVSGVGKGGVNYLVNNDDPFKAFNIECNIPAEYAGKLTHTYIDEPLNINIKDYNGEDYNVSQLSSIHLEPASYSMNPLDNFVKWLLNFQEVRVW